MFIKGLEVDNFKSFQALKITLNDLNILIGANASGKSNFVLIFKFLRHIVQHGLADAISMEGGVEYLRNISIGNKENLRFKLTYNPHSRFAKDTKSGLFGVQMPEATYEFEISFYKRGKGFRIIKDQLVITYQIVALEKGGNGQVQETSVLGKGAITYRLTGAKIQATLNLPAGLPLPVEAISPLYDLLRMGVNLPDKTLFLETPFFNLAHNWLLENHLANIAIYDFDPKLSKKAASITGKTELEEDASNLSLALKNILADSEQKRKFMNLINYLLPFVNDFSVMNQADKSLLFALRESHYAATYLPAFLLSDGTVNLTALIMALYFTENPLLVLEEPERAVHPSLIGKMVGLFEEISADKQILITTHNPEIVRHAPLENLLLIARDQSGFSQINRPSESKQVQVFMENEIGIEDLYVQNLLGV